ncbi:target of rapamycin complex subunit LST8-like [Miscanthus floridulus]|uniref:target of rapamycin complex subunit LST8-like n=1 Tax=Miscanthus floridulus TaxID=154761 RepID=UPI003459B065
MWDGSMVVAANNHGTCYVWRLLKGTQTITCFEPLHKLQAHDGYILKCLLSPEFCDPNRPSALGLGLCILGRWCLSDNSFFRHHSEAMDDVNRRGHQGVPGSSQGHRVLRSP